MNGMTTSLPTAGDQSSDDHSALSRRFVEHAKDELSKGDRLQASEKVWGAVAHAIKAIAVQRGWRHQRHSLITAIGDQLALEYGRPDFSTTVSMAETLHVNYYENQREEPAIRAIIAAVEPFIVELEQVRTSLPRPYTVTNASEQRLLQRILGRSVQINDYSDVGFSQPPDNVAGATPEV
jgi:uncharacterized protein (UPF0332 family)